MLILIATSSPQIYSNLPNYILHFKFIVEKSRKVRHQQAVSIVQAHLDTLCICAHPPHSFKYYQNHFTENSKKSRVLPATCVLCSSVHTLPITKAYKKFNPDHDIKLQHFGSNRYRTNNQLITLNRAPPAEVLDTHDQPR